MLGPHLLLLTMVTTQGEPPSYSVASTSPSIFPPTHRPPGRAVPRFKNQPFLVPVSQCGPLLGEHGTAGWPNKGLRENSLVAKTGRWYRRDPLCHCWLEATEPGLSRHIPLSQGAWPAPPERTCGLGSRPSVERLQLHGTPPPRLGGQAQQRRRAVPSMRLGRGTSARQLGGLLPSATVPISLDRVSR